MILGGAREPEALRMARELARRYARGRAVFGAAPLVLRRPPPTSLQRVHVLRPWSFAPRLAFHLEKDRAPAAPLQPLQPRARERVEKFTERFEERRVRIPSTVERDASPQTRALHPRSTRAVEQVLARPIANEEAGPRNETTPAPVTPPVRSSAGFAPAPSPDVGRLANEVMRVIEKRVVAYRERTGRR